MNGTTNTATTTKGHTINNIITNKLQQKQQEVNLNDMHSTTTTSCESIASNRWNRSYSFDVSYISLVKRHHVVDQRDLTQYDVKNVTAKLTRKQICKSRNTLRSSERNAFCCCSANSDDSIQSNCQSKRERVIRESLNASAKNKITAAPASTPVPNTITKTRTTTIRRQSSPSASLSSSLLPETKSAASSHKRNSNIVGTACNRTLRSRRQATKISTSLPTTPNLSQLRRPKCIPYKKLSLACDDIIVARKKNFHQQSRQQRNQFISYGACNQLQMSATSNLITPTTSTATTTIQQLFAHNQLTIPTAKSTKVAGQYAAKNNNNGSPSPTRGSTLCNCANNNNNNVCKNYSTTKETGNEVALFTHRHNHQQHINNSKNNSASSPTPSSLLSSSLRQLQLQQLSATTTATTMTTTTTAAIITRGKSSLVGCCEHCCIGESGSQMSVNGSDNGGTSNYNSLLTNTTTDATKIRHTNTNHSATMNEEEDSVRYYRAHTDSVSDLSSYRFVSDVDDFISCSARILTSTEIEQQQPNEQIPTTTNSPSNVSTTRAVIVSPPSSPLKVVSPNATNTVIKAISSASTSPTSSPTICCYTIDKATVATTVATAVVASTATAASVVRYTKASSYPVPIALQTVIGNRFNDSYILTTKHFNYDPNECILSTSSPSNYGSTLNCQNDYVGAKGRELNARKQYQHIRQPRRKQQHLQQQQQHCVPKSVPPAPPPKPPSKSSIVRQQVNGSIIDADSESLSSEFLSLSQSLSPESALSSHRLRTYSYDPDSLQRKVEKFDKQTSEAFHEVDIVAEQDQEHEQERCSISPDHCELLNCFATTARATEATVKNTKQPKRQESQLTEGNHIVVPRSSGDNSCCSVKPIDDEKCAIKNKNNLYNNTAICVHVSNADDGDIFVVPSYNTTTALCNLSKIAETNNNYNCKINVSIPNRQQVRAYASELQIPHCLLSPPSSTSSSSSSSSIKLLSFTSLPLPLPPQRTLRYDNHGRLKGEPFLSHHLISNGGPKSLSETRLYRDQAFHRQQQNHRLAEAPIIVKSEQIPHKISVITSTLCNNLRPILSRKLNANDRIEFPEVICNEEKVEEANNAVVKLVSNQVQYGNSVNATTTNEISEISAAITATIRSSTITTSITASTISTTTNATSTITRTGLPPTNTPIQHHQSDLDLQQLNKKQTDQKQKQQLFKSLSDTNNSIATKSHSFNVDSDNFRTNQKPNQRINFQLKSNFPHSESNLSCKYSYKQPISPTSSTSPTSLTSSSLSSAETAAPAIGAVATASSIIVSYCLNQKNSHSLPNVPQSNSTTRVVIDHDIVDSSAARSNAAGTQSPIWLSSETIGSLYSDHHKCLDDTRSNCSDQTTIFHLDNDNSSLSATSSSPSSQLLGHNNSNNQHHHYHTYSGILGGPLILRRIPVIQSFGYIPTHSSSLGSATTTSATNVRDYNDKEINMEKRRNTLDRFQRLGFGRKSSNSTQKDNNSNDTTRKHKSSEKSERLKELTELLRGGNRSSPTPPPIPPPRKPRNGCPFASNSFEKPDTNSSRATSPTTAGAGSRGSAPMSLMSTHSDDITLMDEEEQILRTDAKSPTAVAYSKKEKKKKKNVYITTDQGRNVSTTSPNSSTASTPATVPLYDTLKPNTSLSNFESLMMARENSKSPPTILEVDQTATVTANNTDIAPQLTKPESRTVIGSYTQKGIPFRSASFSQIDYSSGKYKKSALSALRDRLRRDKPSDAASSTTNTDVGSVNLTLPRKKGERSKREEVKENTKPAEPDWIYVPLKKTEVDINLNYGQEIKNLENVTEAHDAIPEEDVFTTDGEQISSSCVVVEEEKEPTVANIAAMHAKMESLTDTIHSENDYTIAEEHLPLTVASKNLVEATCATDSVEVANPKPLESLEQNLATLMEVQIPLESPPENFLQTATTCLIPLPVYECAAQEWRMENPPHEWIKVSPEEFGVIPETIQPLVSINQCSAVAIEMNENEQNEPPEKRNGVPIISVRRSSAAEEENEEEKILRKKSDLSANVIEMKDRRQSSMDQVKKRYSHDDMEIGNEHKRTSLDGITTRYSADERKRIDKSKRRKGMYIDNAAWNDPTNLMSTNTKELALDISIAIKAESPEERSILYLNSPPTDDNCTPGSLFSYDLNTPESDSNKPPSWTKIQRLTAFSCQSSEEKDDASNVSTGGSSTGGGGGGSGATSAKVSLSRNNKSYPFIRMDSMSDNESDPTPPHSIRDRISPSPGLSDYDFKRYSKRPLRGPYGQMLEAEMKKPNKMHFEEILEDLRESDTTTQPRRQRAAHDDAGGGRNMPQYSNSVRVRKTNTNLPLPAHARAASTPSQIENVNNNVAGGVVVAGAAAACVSGGNSVIIGNETRLGNSNANDKDSNNETKEQQQQQQRDTKRAASETPSIKPNHTKRSQSMSGEKQHLQHAHQQKRSLDSGGKLSKQNTSSSSGGNNTPKQQGIMPTQELLAELLKGSSERLLSEQRQQMYVDTRTHVVHEIFRNEQSYVDSLQTVVMKYFKALKSPEHSGMVDSRTVDEIFFMVPDILAIHEKFLSDLKSRLDTWSSVQKVGDAFLETFSKLEVLEVYTSFVNNCNRAKNAIRLTKHQRPSFAKFLESTAREHKGKLTLDNLLIKPVQKFPNYEMLFQRLIKHTDHDHPDQKHLQDVLKLVHDILVHINCKEREILENGQREATLRELETAIEGISDLTAPDRQFLLFELVSMPSPQGARKERGVFLFNDILVLTSIKKRSGTIRRPNPSTCPGIVASTLDTNRYKFLTKIPLDCLEIVKTKDENVRRLLAEIEFLAEDCKKLQKISDITMSLKYPHNDLDDVIRELHRDVQRQLLDRQANDAQLSMMELLFTSTAGSKHFTLVFSKPEKRAQWHTAFIEAKHKIAAVLENPELPDFLTSIPIRKTRAGLQFTCASATLSDKRDVWVCNSDGYVGQVCIMSLHPEPNVTSCNGVCNARILCVASVPAYTPPSPGTAQPPPLSAASAIEEQRGSTPPLSQNSYTQQLRDYRKSISPNCQTATAGTSSMTVCASAEKKKTPVGGTNNSNGINGGGGAVVNNNNNNNNNGSDINLELNSSSSDEEADATVMALGKIAAGTSNVASTNSSSGVRVGLIERVPSPVPSIHAATSIASVTSTTSVTAGSSTGTPYHHSHQDSNPEENEGNQSTMWIGTEDGCIHVYNSTDNIRIKKNRIKIEHHSAVYCILYLDNRVFVSLANGDICVYLRDGTAWNTSSSHCLSIGTVTSPVTKLLNVHGRLWCSIQGIIKVLDVETLVVVNQIQISADNKPITNMTISENLVWISIQNSSYIKCFHSISHQLITEVNLAPAVNKMLSHCDEIIRQHKAACLRVTALLSCKDLIWIGTSAGVLLTIPAQGYDGVKTVVPTGIPQGHTGHVRFLTFVEATGMSTGEQTTASSGSSSTATVSAATTRDSGGGTDANTEYNKQSSSSATKQYSIKTKSETTNNILVISGGDGFEDFRNSGANSLSEIAGREDSTNHLLIWQI